MDTHNVDNYFFAPPPHDVMPLFHLEDDLRQSMAMIGADALIEKWDDNSEPMTKIEIPIIASQFVMCIQNMVLTFEIKDNASLASTDLSSPEVPSRTCPLNLMALTRYWRFMGAQYNPGRFDSVIMRQRKYDAAALYFNSGKLVLTGCFRPEQALDQALCEQENLNAVMDIHMNITSPVLQNIVSSGVFPYPICINYMAVMHSTICYKVGKFPGTMIKDPDQFGDRAILVFDSGRICHSGARNPMHIYDDLKKVCHILFECATTPKLSVLDKMCLKNLKNVTTPEQYVRETQALRRTIDRRRKKALKATTCSQPEQALDQVLYEQEKLNVVTDMNITSAMLQNIVSSGAFPHAICINYMTVMHSTVCYKGGKFPGTMIKDPDQFGNRVILVFDSGRICHLGAEEPTHIYDDLKKIYHILFECAATPELSVLDTMCLENLKNITSPEQYVRDTLALKKNIDHRRKEALKATTTTTTTTTLKRPRPETIVEDATRKKRQCQ